ncbi:MAG: hypothetical protein HY685_04275 [Chloroflexi bacterium]|nr:hypothetical protein [Chloroflexota bacterium]
MPWKLLLLLAVPLKVNQAAASVQQGTEEPLPRGREELWEAFLLDVLTGGG